MPFETQILKLVASISKENSKAFRLSRFMPDKARHAHCDTEQVHCFS